MVSRLLRDILYKIYLYFDFLYLISKFSTMVYQTVDEQIETATIYKQGEVKPVAFRWGNKKYFIDKVNLIHTRYEGAVKCYFFSVSASLSREESTAARLPSRDGSVSTKNGGEYQLKYNTDNLRWYLDEFYLE